MENGKGKSRGKEILKGFLIGALAIVVIAAAVVGLIMAGLPSWPFVLFLFGFFTFTQMQFTNVVVAAVGSIIGLLIGFSNVLVTHFTGNETIGYIVYFVLLVVAVGLLVGKVTKYIDSMCLLMITALACFHEAVALDEFLKIVISLLIGIVIFVGVSFVISRKKPKTEQSV